MKRVIAFTAAFLVSAFALGQSLGELAKKERKRREKNKERGIQVRTLTDKEVATAPAYSGTSSGEGDLEPASSEENLEGSTATDIPPAAAKNPAPPFTLPDRNGRRVSLSEFRGRPVLLDFWATWCGPCRSTMPEVERLHRKYRGKGLQVVGINIEGKSEKVVDFVSQARCSFLILYDEGNWSSEVARKYGVSSIPRTFLIDRTGNIVYSGHPGSLSESLIEAMLR